MRNNNVMGIIFANENDDLLSELTEKRSMASVPFGGRYRLIDFSLSNLVNAGISKVGIITKANYRSLMDHIGSAKSWDLDRKKGGLHILPPYNNSAAGIYKGHVDALGGIMDFLGHAGEQYVVLCNSCTALNMDLNDMLEKHIADGADITVAYKNGPLPINRMSTMTFGFDGCRINKIMFGSKSGVTCDFDLGIIVLSRTLLMSLVDDAVCANKVSLTSDVIMPNVDKLIINGYKFEGFSAVMDSAQSYVDANMALLRADVRADLFNPARPVYTKVKDAMPTRYGLSSSVSNSLIGDGCVIEGTVKNSIIFRDVHIGKGAVVENCIVMQGTEIGDNSELKFVTIDKEAKIRFNCELCGAPSYYIFIKKGAVV